MNTTTNAIKKPKTKYPWYTLDIALVLAIICFILLYVFGALWYIAGLMMSSILILLCVYGFIPFALLTLIYLVVPLLARAFLKWQQYIVNIKKLMIMRFLIISFTVVALLSSFLVYRGSFRPFIHGFRLRMKVKADIPSIRKWLSTIEVNKNNPRINIAWKDQPKSIRKLKSPYCYVKLESNNDRKVEFLWGTGFGHWGFVVNAQDSLIPESDKNKYILPIESGVYVWSEIQ